MVKKERQRYLLFNKPVVLGIESKRSWLKWTTEKFYFGTYNIHISFRCLAFVLFVLGQRIV